MKKLIELKSLNIVFYENKFYTISGSNNSGKTTLIRILNASDNLFKAVIPFELRINRDNLLEELNYQKIDKELVDYILKGLKIKGISKQPINSLSKKEIILIQIALALAKRPKALLLDSIYNYLSEDDVNKNILQNLLSYYSTFHKTDEWNNEHEYRCMFGASMEEISFYKNTRGNYIPYISIELPITALREIVIGPACGENAKWMALSLLVKLKTYELPNPPSIHKSRCPLQ